MPRHDTLPRVRRSQAAEVRVWIVCTIVASLALSVAADAMTPNTERACAVAAMIVYGIGAARRRLPRGFRALLLTVAIGSAVAALLPATML